MLLIVILVFLSVFSFTWWSGFSHMVAAGKIQDRLRDISGEFDIDHSTDENQGVIVSRLARFISDKTIGLIGKLMPEHMNSKLGSMLAEAGLSPKISWREWRLISVLLGVVLPIMMVQVLMITGVPFGNAFMNAFIVGVGSQLLLRYYLLGKAKQRRAKIVAELPDILDLITVSVEAGLSFDGAIDRVASEADGPLATEFALTLKELRMGKTRRDALRRMSERCSVPDLTALVGSIIQADELGVAIGKILRIQSEQMRERRKQRAREKSMKAPVKMLFPLLFFIFPSIIIVLLGPAIIRMSEMF